MERNKKTRKREKKEMKRRKRRRSSCVCNICASYFACHINFSIFVYPLCEIRGA